MKSFHKIPFFLNEGFPKAANCELSRRHRFEDFNPSANCFSSRNFFLLWPVLVCEGKTLIVKKKYSVMKYLGICDHRAEITDGHNNYY